MSKIRAASLGSLLMLLVCVPVGGASAADAKIVIKQTSGGLTVETHGATLREVLDRMSGELKIRFSNSDRVDLTRSIDGRTSGSLRDVMAWLVPDGSFVVLYDDATDSDGKAVRIQRISFLSRGPQKPVKGGNHPVGPTNSAPKVTVTPDTHVVTAAPPPVAPTVAPTAVPAPAAPPAQAAADEPRSVTDQLRAATNQLASSSGSSEGGQSQTPAFLNGPGDGSQQSLQQQAARSQALAVEQLNALMNAFKAACTGNPNGPC